MKIPYYVLMLLPLAMVGARAASNAPNPPLVADGPIVVDTVDFHGNILRIPENRRGDFRMSYDRIASVVDGIFIARNLAGRARELGIDKDPAVQARLRQVQENLLADLYIQRIEKEIAGRDLEQRARELYAAEKSKYVEPEQVKVQHILIDFSGRTRATALELAAKVAAEAREGKTDFTDLAARYSDAPDKSRNGGDLGFSSPAAFIPPLREAIAKMTKPGEVSDPIESPSGFHVVKFLERKPPQPLPFEKVRQTIIDAEVQRLQKQRRDAIVNEIRGSPTATVHRENVEALVVPVDLSIVQKAMEAAPK